MSNSKAKSRGKTTSHARVTRTGSAESTKIVNATVKIKPAPTTNAKAKSQPKAQRANGKAPSSPSDQKSRGLRDWRAQTLDRMRKLIHEADPQMIEERKWKKPSNAMVGIP